MAIFPLDLLVWKALILMCFRDEKTYINNLSEGTHVYFFKGYPFHLFYCLERPPLVC